MPTALRTDVLVVGAGVGGAALAASLGQAGISVVLVEKTTQHRDQVRGEWLAPWGGAEAQRLGFYSRYREAGAHHVTRHMTVGEEFSPQEAEAGIIPLDELVEGVPGPLCIGHPQLCDLLCEVAVEAGVDLIRGIDDLRMVAGRNPSATFQRAGELVKVQARWIVGADGRNGASWRQLGFERRADPPHHLFAGMLIDGAGDWPAERQCIGTEGDRHFLIFPQGGGRVRAYLGYPLDQKKRLAGDSGPQAFLDAFRLDCLPAAEAIATGTPAGPCASFPNNDTWVDVPVCEGAVLIGDAAGHNDPIIGQGLSITHRDVRIVRDILLSTQDWNVDAFAEYVRERRERMRRLRIAAHVSAVRDAEFTPEARDRRRRMYERIGVDMSALQVLLCGLTGPDSVPAEALEDATISRLMA